VGIEEGFKLGFINEGTIVGVAEGLPDGFILGIILGDKVVGWTHGETVLGDKVAG